MIDYKKHFSWFFTKGKEKNCFAWNAIDYKIYDRIELLDNYLAYIDMMKKFVFKNTNKKDIDLRFFTRKGIGGFEYQLKFFVNDTLNHGINKTNMLGIMFCIAYGQYKKKGGDLSALPFYSIDDIKELRDNDFIEFINIRTTKNDLLQKTDRENN